MSVKLRDFIRTVRNCRTAMEERTVVAKECALIRTSLKEEVKSQRHRNIAKLLFIHMMGYPTDFGRIECLRLIASSNFADKRIGYLGLCQFMDEDDDLLMLVTNSIKNDLNNSNQYICTLALIALANIGSSEMCLTLAPEVEALCLSSNQFVKRKAIVCSVRILRKVEDIGERFIRILPSLVQDQSHGALLAGAALICNLVECDPSIVTPIIHEILPYLISRLKHVMTMSGYSNNLECDIGGICNPFLQVKLLEAIRVLNQSEPDSTSGLTDLVSQVIVSTSGAKNTGCAILLECTKIISSATYDKPLVCLCQNILDKLLQHKDNNIRYVGLCCVQQLIKTYPLIFEREGHTIAECLKDDDSSIQRRALQVIYCMVNETNVCSFLHELIGLILKKPQGILSYDDREFYSDLAFRTVACIEYFSPTKRYEMDALIHLLCVSNDLHNGTAAISLITLISLTPELQYYATLKLFLATKSRLSKPLLLQVTIWTLGEYGHLLVENTHINMSITSDHIMSFLESCVDQWFKRNQTTQDILETEESRFSVGESYLMSRVMQGESDTTVLKSIPEYLLNALIKLSGRLKNVKSRIQTILMLFHSHPNVELQQRSLEYFSLSESDYDAYRSSVVDMIPCTLDQINSQPQLAGILKRPLGETSFNIETLTVENNNLQHLTFDITTTTKDSSTYDVTTDLLFLQEPAQCHTPQREQKEQDEKGEPKSKLTDLLDLLDVSSPTPPLPPNHDLLTTQNNSLLDINLSSLL